jgi:hypothetical protein
VSRRSALIASLLAALVAGGALAAVLGRDDEPAPRPAASPTGDDRSGTEGTDGTDSPDTLPEARPPTTEQTPARPDPVVSPRDERGIEQAVADAAAAVEAGSPPPGIDPGDLPGTDELSIDTVRAEGDRGRATLSSGAVVQLERSGGRWRIVGVRGS